MIFLVTQSYYPQLVEGGVQIFQYRPGFVHAKCAVCDDKIATVGTINLDYRSLYLHFENGLFLYNNDTVMDIKKDILDTLEDCNRIMPEMCKKICFSCSYREYCEFLHHYYKMLEYNGEFYGIFAADFL